MDTPPRSGKYKTGGVPSFSLTSSPRQAANTRPRTPRSGAVSSTKKRAKLVVDVAPSTPSNRKSSFSLSSPSGVSSPLASRLNSPARGGMTPRSLKKDLDNSCRYIPVRDDETMDVVRHVVVNGVNGTGGELGKENPDAEVSRRILVFVVRRTRDSRRQRNIIYSFILTQLAALALAQANAPPPSPAIGVADEFRRRMRGALLKVPMPHANPSTQSSVDLGEEENVDSSNTQRLLSFTTRQRGRPGHGSGGKKLREPKRRAANTCNYGHKLSVQVALV